MGRKTMSTALHGVRVVSGYGDCEHCGRGYKYLANGLCEDCRFYGIAETDKDVSRRSTEAIKRGRVIADIDLR